MAQKILIVDDEASHRALLSHAVSQKLGYDVVVLPGGKQAVEWLLSGQHPLPDLMLLDLAMPGMDGQQVIETLRAAGVQLPIVVLTMYGNLEKAVAAVRAGADDFLPKPVTLERLQLSLQTQLKLRGLMQQVRPRLSGRAACFTDIICRCDAMVRVVEQAKDWSQGKTPVLIDGPEGCGKTMLAQAMHEASGRPPLLHREVLWEEKPSFVDELLAQLPSLAGGTLTIDLGTAAAPPFSKLRDTLLPMLARHGVRLLVTSRHAQTSETAFRLVLPPLCERGMDLTLLANAFLHDYALQEHRPVYHLHTDALEWMQTYPWPGNVRELAHRMYRAVIVAEGAIRRCDLDPVRHKGVTEAERMIAVFDAGGRIRTLESIEAEMIRLALKYCNGCMSQAAKALGIGRTTLYRKLDIIERDTPCDGELPPRRIV